MTVTPEFVLLALLSFLVLDIVLYLLFLSPPAVKRRRLTKQARLDYRSARGTAHLRMMEAAYKRWDKDHKQAVNHLKTAQRKLASLERSQQQELTKALEKHIVMNRLGEVPGIGPALQKRIISRVFRGRLTDLKKTSNVRGVGPILQRAINRWVQSYKSRLPSLLETDFPGKQAVLSRYEQSISPLKAEIQRLEKRKGTAESKLQRLRPEISKLKAVKAKDFVRALQDPANASAEIDNYLQGVFAEWEPIPNWFKDVMSTEVG